jgi:murein DD-endopeptidase MepM/ murein hydrolase activator NlpD
VRNTFTITITDFRGARHYPIHQIAKTYALAVAVSLAVTFLLGAGLIYWLSSRVDGLNDELAQLQARRQLTQGEFALLLEEHERLKQAVAEKEKELALVSDELGNIEVMIGLESDPGLDIKARVDTASQTAVEKMFMLQSIPSGYPLEYKGKTSNFGYRVHPVKGERAFHSGVDLRAKTGTPVYATADGVVEWAAYHKPSGLGNLVIIHHNFGFNTFYGHLDRFAVKAGDFVRKGDIIAYSGNSGLSSGPHLHYEVRHIQRRLNPEPFMQWTLNQYDSLFEKEGRVQWDSLARAVKEKFNTSARRLSLLEVSSEAN